MGKERISIDEKEENASMGETGRWKKRKLRASYTTEYNQANIPINLLSIVHFQRQ